MTYGKPVRIEPDGTHVYANYHRYKPVPKEKRKYAVRKPSDPDAFRVGGVWYLPLPLLPDQAREMPETVPDEETLYHRAYCRCEVCQRPGAVLLWRRAHGLGWATRASGIQPAPTGPHQSVPHPRAAGRSERSSRGPWLARPGGTG